MPRAVEKTSTYIWASEALGLLIYSAYGSIETAERVLLREAKAGRIPWTLEDVDPPGTPIDELWQESTLEARLAQNAATFKEPYSLPSGAFMPDLGFNTIKVGGIKFERAAVEALRPAGLMPPLATQTAPAPPSPSPPSSDLVRPVKPGDTTESWVFDVMQTWPKPRDMSPSAYVDKLEELSGGRWKREAVRRRYYEQLAAQLSRKKRHPT